MYLVDLGISQAKQVLLIGDGAEWIWIHIPPLLARLGCPVETLAGIEEAVRSQMQKHVMPEVGVFYRNGYRHKRRISTTTEKYFGRIANNKQAGAAIRSPE